MDGDEAKSKSAQRKNCEVKRSPLRQSLTRRSPSRRSPGRRTPTRCSPLRRSSSSRSPPWKNRRRSQTAERRGRSEDDRGTSMLIKDDDIFGIFNGNIKRNPEPLLEAPTQQVEATTNVNPRYMFKFTQVTCAAGTTTTIEQPNVKNGPLCCRYSLGAHHDHAACPYYHPPKDSIEYALWEKAYALNACAFGTKCPHKLQGCKFYHGEDPNYHGIGNAVVRQVTLPPMLMLEEARRSRTRSRSRAASQMRAKTMDQKSASVPRSQRSPERSPFCLQKRTIHHSALTVGARSPRNAAHQAAAATFAAEPTRDVLRSESFSRSMASRLRRRNGKMGYGEHQALLNQQQAEARQQQAAQSQHRASQKQRHERPAAANFRRVPARQIDVDENGNCE